MQQVLSSPDHRPANPCSLHWNPLAGTPEENFIGRPSIVHRHFADAGNFDSQFGSWQIRFAIRMPATSISALDAWY
jgi:hypothetical protein